MRIACGFLFKIAKLVDSTATLCPKTCDFIFHSNYSTITTHTDSIKHVFKTGLFEQKPLIIKQKQNMIRIKNTNITSLGTWNIQNNPSLLERVNLTLSINQNSTLLSYLNWKFQVTNTTKVTKGSSAINIKNQKFYTFLNKTGCEKSKIVLQELGVPCTTTFHDSCEIRLILGQFNGVPIAATIQDQINNIRWSRWIRMQQDENGIRFDCQIPCRGMYHNNGYFQVWDSQNPRKKESFYAQNNTFRHGNIQIIINKNVYLKNIITGRSIKIINNKLIAQN